MRGLESVQDILTGTGARINEAAGAQFFKGGAIDLETLTLRIRPEGAAAVRSLLPLETEPMEVFEHGSYIFRAAARAVQVLSAQYEYSLVFTGALLGSPEGAGVAEVEKTRGRRSEARAVEGM